jgi:hypothetical protein
MPQPSSNVPATGSPFAVAVLFFGYGFVMASSYSRVPGMPFAGRLVTSRHDMVHRSLKLDSDLSRHPFSPPIFHKSVKIC